MSSTKVAAQISDLASNQWGLLTTTQAEAEGVSRLQLARLADAGVIERVDRGIYGIPAAMDERTELRAAWLSLDPKVPAEARLADPVSSGVISHTSAAALYEIGDLLSDVPEITVGTRKQSRRGIRLHRGALSPEEVTTVQGLPVTTPARTVADLIRDGHDVSHVAEVAGESLRRELVTRQDLAIALEPVAKRYDQPTGTALLEHLLDLVGLSETALATKLASSGLGQSLVSAGQLSAVRSILEARTSPSLMKNFLDSLDLTQIPVAALDAASKDLSRAASEALANLDTAAILAAANVPSLLDADSVRSLLGDVVPAELIEMIRRPAAEPLHTSASATKPKTYRNETA